MSIQSRLVILSIIEVKIKSLTQVFIIVRIEAEEKDLIIGEILEVKIIKDQGQDLIIKDLNHIPVTIRDFHREHQQEETAGVHREMDLEIEVMVKSL